jgi:3D (Asp-Asp-Asp) domain-containing protein
MFSLAGLAGPTMLSRVNRSETMKIPINFPKIALAAVCSTALLISGCVSAGKPSSKAKPKTVPVTATAYSSGAKCNGVWAQRNAIGGRLQSGQVNSAAADWSRFPLGTKFRVAETGKVYVVDDYGSAMVGKDKVDLFHTSYRDVYRWGVRQVNLEIIEWGCPEKSLAILKPRARAPHVRRMVEALQVRQQGAG